MNISHIVGVMNFINKFENDIFTGGDEMIIKIFARQVYIYMYI
jgi:hypothetical protein